MDEDFPDYRGPSRNQLDRAAETGRKIPPWDTIKLYSHNDRFFVLRLAEIKKVLLFLLSKAVVSSKLVNKTSSKTVEFSDDLPAKMVISAKMMSAKAVVACTCF